MVQAIEGLDRVLKLPLIGGWEDRRRERADE
jgi:hypothetical protein